MMKENNIRTSEANRKTSENAPNMYASLVWLTPLNQPSCVEGAT